MIDTSGFTDKASKRPAIRKLYDEKPYLMAYSEHTDLRVDRDGPKAAIGKAEEWESHGQAQLDFLVSQGLTPEDTLLDLGCGSGRLARKAVPYLEPGRYIGADISPKVLEHASRLSVSEGWVFRSPKFLLLDTIDLSPFIDLGRMPDVVWAHSVFTHLPPHLAQDMIREVTRLEPRVFLLTYKHSDAPERTGLKQFKYPAEWFAMVAESLGWRAEDLGHIWPAKQRTIRMEPA